MTKSPQAMLAFLYSLVMHGFPEGGIRRVQLAMLLASVSLAGCAWHDRRVFDELKAGMASAEVEDLVGKPKQVATRDGSVVWRYCGAERSGFRLHTFVWFDDQGRMLGARHMKSSVGCTKYAVPDYAWDRPRTP